jgi:hypothetical protein
MMDLLATGETAYLGNDLIYVDGRRAVMPPIWGPSVGCKTLLSLPRFSWLAEEKAGAAVGRYIRSNTGEMKLYIPLQNLVSHLGVPLASTVALRAVFFPSLDLDGDGVRTEPLEWSDARDALRSSANLVGDADHPDWMGLVPGNNDAEEIDRRIRDLFSGLTLARVVLGCRSRGKGDLLRALLCVSHE